MSDNQPLYCATDHEIFATLMSSPQHFSIKSLREMGRRRCILYSEADTREEIIGRLSTQSFGAAELKEIQAQFDYRSRGETRKVIRLDYLYTVEELRRATDALRDSLPKSEKVFTAANGSASLDVNIQYTDVDFSMVRLRQRQRREANVTFDVEDGKTKISLPSGPRARAFVDELRTTLAKDKPNPIQQEEITLTGLSTALSRTKFFINLISSLPGYTLSGVVKVAVERASKEDNTLALNSGEEEGSEASEESEEMLGVVQNVALRGDDLLQSRVYQDLRRRHYSIRSVRWKARRDATPYPVLEFECGFEDEELGSGFRFAVLGKFVQTRVGSYQKIASPLESIERKEAFAMLDQRSIALYREARAETPQMSDTPDPLAAGVSS